MKNTKTPKMFHYVNESDLRRVESGHSSDEEELSATQYSSRGRKFHGSSGCSCGGGVRSITIRTLIRRQEGSGMVEYVILLAFISITVVCAALMLGHALRDLIGRGVEELVK